MTQNKPGLDKTHKGEYKGEEMRKLKMSQDVILSTWQMNKTESMCSTQRQEQNMDEINKTRLDPDRFTKSTTKTLPTNPAASVNDV